MNETMKELLQHKENVFKHYGVELRKPNKQIMEYLDSMYSRKLVAKIYANRYESIDELRKYIETKLSDILSMEFLKRIPDIDKAADLILDKINKGQRILIVTDYDVDGITSAVLAYKMFMYLFEYDNIQIVINRREYGNGINDTLRDQILKIYKDQPFDLLITADHGSHDASNLSKIKEETGANIVVTDHHLFSYDDGTTPFDVADAFINPQRNDCSITKKITGANVLYFTLLYAYFRSTENIHDESVYQYQKIAPDIPGINKKDYYYYLINYVGLTVISDSVSIKDYINRKILIKALSTINNRYIEQDTFWTVILEHLNMHHYVDETVLAFNVVPVLNSPGRIDNPRLSFELMTAEDPDIARVLLEDTLGVNVRRKEKQSKAKTSTDVEVYKTDKIYVSVIEDTSGIQGIVANNILYSTDYEVVICFTRQRNENGTSLLGSGRAKDSVNLVELLDKVNDLYPGLIKGHGGHAQAAGVKIEDNLAAFFNAVKEVSKDIEFKQKQTVEIDDIIISNKKLVSSYMDVKDAGPYGMDNPVPTFASEVSLVAYRIIKKPGARYLLMDVKLSDISDFTVKVFYTIKDTEDSLIQKLKYAKKLLLVYSLNLSLYMGQKKIQLSAEKVEVIESRE